MVDVTTSIRTAGPAGLVDLLGTQAPQGLELPVRVMALECLLPALRTVLEAVVAQVAVARLERQLETVDLGYRHPLLALLSKGQAAAVVQITIPVRPAQQAEAEEKATIQIRHGSLGPLAPQTRAAAVDRAALAVPASSSSAHRRLPHRPQAAPR
ncbi:MAG: hypothetical protein EBR82_44055 [Caulobacteraceae bacterium]|nr:hypothetical protein [Caulobacteraceae bacterium]NDD05556.1 hypothetical protein [Pseudomonadota bacterium]